MPNYVSNTLIIKGTKEQVNYFVTKGGFQPIDNFNNIEEVAKKLDDAYMRSWLPMPQTFVDYDTTNPMLSKDTWNERTLHEMVGDVSYKEHNTYEEYVRGYKEAIAEQKATYREVGWYKYNLKTLGTKWDCPMSVNTEETFEEAGEVTLYFDFDTAWSMPMEWFEFLCRKFYDLRFFIYGAEESGLFYKFYSNVTGNEDNLYYCLGELRVQEVDEENEEACARTWDKIDSFKSKFLDFAQDN